MTGRRRVLVIGAAGDMLSVTVASLARHDPDLDLICADVDRARLDALAASIHPTAVSTATFDLFDNSALRSAIDGASLVVNGAGPFYKTAGPVIDACLDERVDYLDIGDDVEAARAAIERGREAQTLGVNVLIGCGVSPGLTNVLAHELCALMDEPQQIHVGWCVGDEGPQTLGAAVLEHALHMVSGTTATWENGNAGTHAAWTRHRSSSTRRPS